MKKLILMAVFFCTTGAMMAQITNSNTGNIGIGVSNPTAKLDVAVPSNANLQVSGLRITAPNIFQQGSIIEDLFHVRKEGFNSNPPIALFTVQHSGKVSIGLDPSDPTTFAGDYKLYVEDGILTEKVKVAWRNSSDWADYVFEDSYPLMPLAELESYVRENRHLPNVPSAREVAENGFDLAQMDAKLLEKIEELTLHLLAQQKQIDALEAQLKTAHQ